MIDSEHTAQGFVTTDLDDNQIWAFHPGAMQLSHQNQVDDAKDIAIGIVAPDGRDGMIQHAAQFAAAGIPFIFDPGQGLPMFSGDDLRAFIKQATWVAVNDYEWQLVQEKTKLSAQEIAAQVEALIVTRGAEGSVIYTQGSRDRDSDREADSGRRSDRLRRCLSRRPDARPAARPRLGNDRAHRLAARRDQDRIARHAEPHVHGGRVRAALPGQLRHAVARLKAG